MLDEIKIRELKRKRTDRFCAVSTKIKMYADDCDFYRDSEGKTAIKNAIRMIKKNTKYECLTINNERMNCYYLNIDDIYEANKFVNEVVDNLKQGNYRFIECDVKKTQKELIDNYVKPASNKIYDKTEYIKAVNLLANCERMSRTDIFEKDLHELKKDLLSCIKYNKMIKAELERA